MSNYGLLLGILYALSNEVLMASASDLTEDKTDLVLEQTGLCLVILFRK